MSAKTTRLHAQRDGGPGEVGLKKPGRAIGLKAVADAEDGLDVLIGVATQLFAEAADVYVESAGADLGAIAPDLHQQSFARNDLPGVLYQQGQQVVLLTG